MENEVHKKSGDSNYYNTHQLEPSMSNYSIQMDDYDLPPISQSGDQSDPVGFFNPIYESLAGEHTDDIYEEMNVNNPCKEDVDALDVATPIHPTGMQMKKENPLDN